MVAEGVVRDLDGPIRVFSEEVAILGDHFGFEPESELDTLCADGVGQFPHGSGDFLFVCGPVSQGASVAVSFSEPSVVEDEEVHAVFLGGACQIHQFFLGEIEVHGLPVVDEDRPWGVSPPSGDEVVSEEVVEGSGESSQSIGGESLEGLRGLEGVAGLEEPLEALGMESQAQACAVEWALIHLDGEISAIDQECAVGASRFLGGRPVAEDDAGVHGMSGESPGGLQGFSSSLEGFPVEASFLSPEAIEEADIQGFVPEIGSEGIGAEEFRRGVPPVDDHHGACNGGEILEGGISEDELDVGIGVFQGHLQGLCLLGFGVGGGESRQCGLAGEESMGDISRVGDHVSPGIPDGGGGGGVDPDVLGGELPELVFPPALVVLGVQGGFRGVCVFSVESCQFLHGVHPAAPVEMLEPSVGGHLESVGGLSCIDSEEEVIFVDELHRHWCFGYRRWSWDLMEG